MSGEAGAALPRAMTGKGLLRLLLRQGDARYRYEDPEVTPVAARPALAAIANLVARAGGGGWSTGRRSAPSWRAWWRTSWASRDGRPMPAWRSGRLVDPD